MRPETAVGIVLVVTLTSAPLASGPSEPAQLPSPAEQLIRQEEVRRAYEDALDRYTRQESDGRLQNENLVEAVESLVQVGDEVVPLVASELLQQLPQTYFFAAYALGRLATPEAEAALREAITRAERELTDYALSRKAWACYGLGLAGQVDALDLFNEGRHDAASTGIHADMSMLEAVALQTAPESASVLLAQFERYDDDNDPRLSERNLVIKALGRVADPATIPHLVRMLREEHPLIARQAAYALGEIGSAAAADVLLEELDADDVRVRKAVALALENALPVGRLEPVLARLPVEDQPVLRGALYRVLARAGGAELLPALREQWGRSDPLDRVQLIRAVGSLRHDGASPLLVEALRDPAAEVHLAAATALAELGTPVSREALLDAVNSSFWTLAAAGVEQLTRLRESRAAAPIADRLLDVELAIPVRDPRRRLRAQRLAQALVDLRAPLRLEDWKTAIGEQPDAQLVLSLEQALEQLRVIQQNGTKAKRWSETLETDDPALRRIAYRALADSGSKRAAPAMVRLFGRVEPDEGAAILHALGRIDSAESRKLISRVLLEPAFDTVEREALRDAAAWAARRLGGDEMRQALASSVERRRGRDFKPLVYYALVDPEGFASLYERLRVERMRYLKWSRGHEQKRLDWIRRELAAGRSLDSVDLPPERLSPR